ncbi:MAG: PTS IIA-like nitrogen regulatory protein PtsN [Sphingomonadales bacterium]|nr:PTS IIA-like nitrogen regulatory protein PtsN [Sphingomonadales bacterium]
MEIGDLIGRDAILPALKASSKKHVLQELAQHAAEMTGLDSREIFEALLEREKLGTTGVGQGVAIPHGKFAALDRIWAIFARLDHPIDFEALDERPVDLIVLLLAPSDAGAEHLKALARVSRLLRDTKMCEKIRGSESGDALYALLTEVTATAA